MLCVSVVSHTHVMLQLRSKDFLDLLGLVILFRKVRDGAQRAKLDASVLKLRICRII